MSKRVTVETHSEDETRLLGSAIGTAASRGDILLLFGPFGAGKTTLVQGIARGLGIEGPVTSPSFVLANEYYGRIPLYHIDLYRVDRMDAATLEALAEYFGGEGICTVEWPASLPTTLVEDAITIELAITGEESRGFTMETSDAGLIEIFERRASSTRV